MLWISGCASSSNFWYKPGHSQVDFDIDHRECRMIAEEIGRQATLTGEKINPGVFATTYNNCLFSRGWTHTPPGVEQKKGQAVVLAEVSGNCISVFDRQLSLPPELHLISNQITGFEDVSVQTLVFQGEGPVFLNITLQQTLSRQFDPIEYAVNEPFFVFEKGTAKAGGGQVNWTVFSGDFKGNWVAGIGAYYLADKNKRISFVLTQAIQSPMESPPEGLRLTKRQKLEVESFSDQWLEEIKTAFGAKA